VASLNLSSYSIFIAAIFSLIGTYFLGRKTVRTAGEKIVSLDPSRAFAAQISGALIVEIFTQMHLPVSITQAVIGGIIGTGLVKGYRELNRKTLKNLAISWVLAPILSFLLTLGIIMLSFSL
ncbi:MAG: inorganic phosphate transporter, partial [Thermoplasmata archaeon]|nr:inorganic phosphate transporter [Thermoplasmata archaeon]